jgi:hypothetical protein
MKQIAGGRRIVMCMLLCSAAAVSAAKDISGGEVYRSKSKLFSVMVPKADYRYAEKFRVVETSEKNNENRVEEAAFVTGYGGEMYRVGVRRIGPDVRSIVENDDLTPSALVYIAVFLHYGGNIPGPPKPSPVEEVPTPHGPAVFAMLEVEGGSQVAMQQLQIGGGKVDAKPIRRDARVAVAAVRKGDYLIYVSAQNDVFPNPSPEALETALKAKLTGMLEGLTFSRDFDK